MKKKNPNVKHTLNDFFSFYSGVKRSFYWRKLICKIYFRTLRPRYFEVWFFWNKNRRMVGNNTNEKAFENDRFCLRAKQIKSLTMVPIHIIMITKGNEPLRYGSCGRTCKQMWEAIWHIACAERTINIGLPDGSLWVVGDKTLQKKTTVEKMVVYRWK